MERFIPKGAEQQNITPELELSIALFGACEKLLQEKGRSGINAGQAILQVLQPIGLARVIKTRRSPQDLVMIKSVKLKRQGVLQGLSDSITIRCNGKKPNETEEIRIYIPWMHGAMPMVESAFLRLKRDEIGKIDFSYKHNPDHLQHNFGLRPATMQDLEAYQRYINQSSPIEYK